MAIKFGDILQNQNSAYPIVDGSNNDIKGVIFSTGLPGAGDFPNKRALGTILVDTAADKMYFYKGADLANDTWSDTDNWSEMAQGSGETIQTEDIPISIPTGTSFGRFTSADGSIDVGSGSTAMQIIIKALTAFQAPEAAFTGGDLNVGYDTTTQTVSKTVTFTVKNNNQSVVAGNTTGSAFAIREVKLFRKLGNGDYTEVANATPSVNDFSTNNFAALNNAGTPTNQSFSFTENVSVLSGSADFTYKVEVTPNDSAGSATTVFNVEGGNTDSGRIDCATYSAPGISSVTTGRANTSSHFVGTSESNNKREKGNIGTKLSFTITQNTSLVPITQFALKRSINGGAATTILTVGSLSLTANSNRLVFDSVATTANNVTGTDTGATGYTNVSSTYPTGNIDANTIQYSIVITDEEGTGSSIDVGSVINLEFPALVGYDTQGGTGNDPTTLTDGQMSTAINAIRSGALANRRQYEIINTSGTGDPDFGSTGISLTPSGTQFTYIAFPATYNEIDTFQKPSTPDEYGSFGSDPRSVTVDFTTHYGILNSNYEVYVSNSAGAFNGTYTIN
jgi:hypothetical protein